MIFVKATYVTGFERDERVLRAYIMGKHVLVDRCADEISDEVGG